MSSSIPRAALLGGTAMAFLLSTAATAQDAVSPQPAPSETQAGVAAPAQSDLPDDSAEDEDSEEIVVVGSRPRGSVIGDIPPENTLNSRDIRATGAIDVTELLEALAPQIGSARGRGGERPILLLNGQRISGFRELRDIPTEAIQRVEILPEEVALKYGYRADQRVVNFILRERFRSTATRVEGRAATQGGYVGGLGDVTRLMIDKSGRTSVNLRADASSALKESERDIVLQPLPANPDLDPREARTLLGDSRTVRGTVTHNRTIFGNVSATVNGELSHSQGQSLLGYPTFADGSPIPIGTDPRARDTKNNSAHAGFALNGDKGSWRWSATGNADLSRSTTDTDADEPIAGLVGDRARSTTASGNVDATANGPLFKLPTGDASATVRVNASTLDLDNDRRRELINTSTSLSRTQGGGSVNVDLPISRRNRDFSALGNLTLKGNAEIQQVSDFGSLTTVGAGLNWSPVNPLNFVASWSREAGAPSVQQLGDPILNTPGTRIFDFTTGETVEVNAITGGNPNLEADRRNVMKLGVNWRPLDETDLRIRADFVRSRLKDQISNFPGPSETLEAAFPERFIRDEDGQLVTADLRPVNFDEARRDTLRWGFDFSKPLRSARPSQAQIDRFRQRARADGLPVPPAGDAPPPGGFGRGGGGFGRFGGGRQGGRLTLSVTHTVNLVDEVTIRPGLPELDYLHGDALGSSGGRPRHEIEAQAGWSNNGLGARLSADWRSETRVDNVDSASLRFSPLATFDLRLFANLGERFDLVEKQPWLRGSQVRVEVDNIFDSKPKVRDAFGEVPLSYQSDLLDPLGRTVSISFRKMFLPPRSAFRRDREQAR